MTILFQRELEKIKKMILSLGAMVEERVRMAVKAIELRDANLAEKIIKSDYEIDEFEVEVEEECLKILALYQPVAIDLRFLIAVIKINNDLERIGDEVVNIAHRVQTIAKRQRLDIPFDHSLMAEKSESMLKKSLDALVNMDVDIALRVCSLDDEVDNMLSKAYDVVKQAIGKHPDRVGYLINLFLVSRHFERIADHATNIAEEVIFLIEGEIIRHQDY
ncbi:MAG: phosphate signaling complex protein PhoU [Desulfobacteraceae bacterium]|nr:phosphate signaling complex protein PhoU [Pseudomonadota bacterium]MBU4462373.1 phosphate signaling complex protein PhoU [Pseudomonadota bacterium]MCG2754328.1 phosphate signaling complex protein PhoU [Desulfobacteraceae bacterium]